jgi:hypothetical protein
MSELSMRGHFRYLRFNTFLMTPRTPQCEVFCPLLLSSKHSGVPENSQPPTFPSVGLHPHIWPKWGCNTIYLAFWTSFLFINMPINPTTYLYTYLPTYAPTFLPTHYAYLLIYVFYITKYLINYLFTFSNTSPPILPINLLRFTIVHGWWTHVTICKYYE